jgi:hypothetical protein
MMKYLKALEPHKEQENKVARLADNALQNINENIQEGLL